MAFDGITLKAISYELKNLIGYKIDKVYEPTKNEILLGLYGNYSKLALNICIDSKFYRTHLTTNCKANPNKSPNFCMLLRKNIIGYKIKDIVTNGLERVLILKLEPFDSKERNSKSLIIELMGKHSNIILTDNNNIIIDSMRHTNLENNSYRNIFPKQQYIFPKSDKLNIYDVNSFDEFYAIIAPELQVRSVSEAISNKFTGISLSHIEFFINNLGHINESNKDDIKKLFIFLKNVLVSLENSNVAFKEIKNKNDYGLIITPNTSAKFDLNFFIDDFYFQKEVHSDFISYRNSILKLILDTLKRYKKRLANIDAKLEECSNMDTYKLYGELLTANLYKLTDKHLESVTLSNYYTSEDIIVPLDKKLNPNENAKQYFKKYNKLKNALLVVEKQKKETVAEINYIESIVYELENSTTIDEVQIIFEEISENVIFKNKLDNLNKKKIKKKNNKVKKDTFNPLSFEFNGYTILIGRNNKENDLITTKYASSTDLWFHAKGIPGSHVVLKANGAADIEDKILIKCARFAALHSKAKNSSNIPVDYCQIKYVKKPNGAKPGMVIYTHNKTLYINT